MVGVQFGGAATTGTGSGARSPSLNFAVAVIQWQASQGRQHLPWQHTTDPYRVWLSEVMLQQTQVSAVLGYYERFLQAYPTVADLAAAPLDEVLALWSGLGYYSRARNLHRCAQLVMQQHGGAFPSQAQVLQTLPGIGRSTAAAIAAFCFGERVAILDGNVKRVLSRVLAFGGDLALAKEEKALWLAATDLLPAEDFLAAAEPGRRPMAAYTQGLMDLGATVCAPTTPRCEACPVASLCAARAAGEIQRYPLKTRRIKRSRRESVWLQLRWRGRVWLLQRPASGVWAGLWSLPEWPDEAACLQDTAHWPGQRQRLESFTHVLTHLDWRLHPSLHFLPDGLPEAQVQSLLSAWPQGAWFGLDEALSLGLPAPLRKWLSA
jgi:A/G-specific adenine glycosylase